MTNVFFAKVESTHLLMQTYNYINILIFFRIKCNEIISKQFAIYLSERTLKEKIVPNITK